MSEGEPTFTDGSDSIFAMYNEMAGEEDGKMAESWQADADRILVFVSSHITLYHSWNTISTPTVVDWPILRRSRSLSCNFNTRPSAESTG